MTKETLDHAMRLKSELDVLKQTFEVMRTRMTANESYLTFTSDSELVHAYIQRSELPAGKYEKIYTQVLSSLAESIASKETQLAAL